MALAIAGAAGLIGFSPMPLTLYGPTPSLLATITVLSAGISLIVGILYSPKLATCTRPSCTGRYSIKP
jgi:hypothetical protein